MTNAHVQKIVIVGIGNVLCRDEGVGVHVIEELKEYNLPYNVEVHDCGTGGLDVLEFLEGSDKAIIVDAVIGEMEPGEIYHVRLDEVDARDEKMKMLSLHELDLVKAIEIGKRAYKIPENIFVIGIEPKNVELGMDLTAEVRQAIPRVIQDIFEIIELDPSKP
ncbi:MAG: hydrogenase maturation protease [Candidatus Bathyarchaeota archaeon]|nr:hydrogenase maturation protease [Candidatus Bathyarchaeota archaeon]